ncbi:MAG: acryloyl-CoA reductase [Hyphomicrobiales bacterium]|mgnify:CR=1 FL=1|nr:acryloyl-CoA reductase [Hyphomicrobiales bacterium]
MQKKFNAWLITKDINQIDSKFVELDSNEYLNNEVIIKVQNSALNYKDALALTGSAPVVRSFPLISGIDMSGIVIESKSNLLKDGDRVFATGWGLGELHNGGLASYASFDADKFMKIPSNFSFLDIMGLGTAGLTAMLSIGSLVKNGITPDRGKILVTGASGAVGSIATTLLLKMGYKVSVVTSRIDDNRDYLAHIGDVEILDSSLFTNEPKMLSKENWAGAIDVVGGRVLENIITQISHSGVVAICGQVRGLELKTNLAPFFLRGIKLIGIDSAFCTKKSRVESWEKIFTLLNGKDIEKISEVIDLDKAYEKSLLIIEGKNKKRIITNHQDL